ncbi:uncharacterized protein LOC122375583 [Amphibalanus amphitrite]|uniref:uncharacterized protein LOC122375583 n=1 Tax=Amphibalanus amphitrite TaxID=1232801 RepID=UPI001C9114B7|nr:uncharacterized protein LOC122375583 [Amphibalanus amphitrite]XP_043211026.1 uncharacterized protein LOC122375583 [Amphibalanus amphitrite]
MRALIVLGLAVAAVSASSDPVSDSKHDSDSDSVVVDGRNLRTSIQADDAGSARHYPGGVYPGGVYPGGVYPGGVYPGGVYPGGGYPGGIYPGYNRPSNCKNWCRRQPGYLGGVYPGYGRQRIQYYCCDHSGPVIVPRPYPVPYPGPYPQPYPGPYPPGPYPGVYSGSSGTVNPPAPPSTGYTGNSGYTGNNGYTGGYNGNNGFTNNRYTTSGTNNYGNRYTANNGYNTLATYRGNRVCPPPRPYCVTSRNFASPPTECAGDHECSAVDRCCFDTCLEHRVCKTADIAAPVGPVPYSNSDLVRHAHSDILADEDGDDVTDDATAESFDVRASSPSDVQGRSGKVTFVDAE